MHFTVSIIILNMSIVFLSVPIHIWIWATQSVSPPSVLFACSAKKAWTWMYTFSLSSAGMNFSWKIPGSRAAAIMHTAFTYIISEYGCQLPSWSHLLCCSSIGSLDKHGLKWHALLEALHQQRYCRNGDATLEEFFGLVPVFKVGSTGHFSDLESASPAMWGLLSWPTSVPAGSWSCRADGRASLLFLKCSTSHLAAPTAFLIWASNNCIPAAYSTQAATFSTMSLFK